MSDDYLWDRSGPADPDVQHLERVLGRLRRSPPPPLRVPGSPRGRLRAWIPLLATAALVVLMVSGVWRTYRQRAVSWEVATLAGQPRIGLTALGPGARLSVGETLTTDATSRARLDVSTIGQVTVEGDTTLRLVATQTAHHRLALDRGTINAFIQAPPGQFVVDTPSARATDLGCVYTLHVDEGGSGLLSVVAGWVAFEFNGRESFVPAGASCPTDATRGPGTPRFDDADRAWQEALDNVDGGQLSGRDRALQRVLGGARVRDAVSLWHLIPRVDGTERPLVYEALAARVPPPADATREAVERLDATALDRWWDRLGLGDTAFWRKWKRAYPAASRAVPSPATQ